MRFLLAIDELNPLTGELSRQGQSPVRFAGRLELLSALELLCDPSDCAPSTPQEAGSGPPADGRPPR